MRLAREGASGLTLVDVSPEGVAETRALVSRANPSCVALVRVADVGDAGALADAFAAHVTRFESMHACFNNAGIGERADWRQVVNVNLCAVVQGTRLAVDAMVATKSASPNDAGARDVRRQRRVGGRALPHAAGARVLRHQSRGRAVFAEPRAPARHEGRARERAVPTVHGHRAGH